MKIYHLYFYCLKLIILTLIIFMSLKIIPINAKYFVIIDTIFKFSLGLFIIIFFSSHRFQNMEDHDRILIILSGLVLLLLIDYIKIINILFNKHIKDDREFITGEI